MCRPTQSRRPNRKPGGFRHVFHLVKPRGKFNNNLDSTLIRPLSNTTETASIPGRSAMSEIYLPDANSEDTAALGTVLSDLHLLTNRTTIEDYLDAIARAGDSSHLVVLNGDIFDFKWSVHGSLHRSIQEAATWLENLASTHPRCRWVVLLGNHDDHPEYRRELTRLAESLPNFAWEDQLLVVGSVAFLHGDACHGGVTRQQLELYRARYRHAEPRAPWQHEVYRLAARARVPAVVQQLVSKRYAAERLDAYLQHTLGQEYHEVTDVYFGHIHQPFTDFEHGGRLYHNTGAALVGQRLQPLEFRVNLSELITIDRQLQLAVDG